MYNATSYTTSLVSNISYYVEDISKAINVQSLENKINNILEEHVDHCCDGYFKSARDNNKTNINRNDNGSGIGTIRTEYSNIPYISKISSGSVSTSNNNIEELRSIEETLEANFINAETSLKRWRKDHYYEKNCRYYDNSNDNTLLDDMSDQEKMIDFEDKDDVIEKIIPTEDSSSTYELACQRIRETEIVRYTNQTQKQQVSINNDDNIDTAAAQEQYKWNSRTRFMNKKQYDNEYYINVQEIQKNSNNNNQFEEGMIQNLNVIQEDNIKFNRENNYQKQPSVTKNIIKLKKDSQQERKSKDKIQQHLNGQQKVYIPVEQMKHSKDPIVNQNHTKPYNSEQEEDEYYNRQKQETARWQKYHFDQVDQIRRQQEEANEVKKRQKYQACQEHITQIHNNQQQHHFSQTTQSQPQHVYSYKNQQPQYANNYSNDTYYTTTENINNIETPLSSPSNNNSIDENIAFIRRNILIKWALQPPTYQNLKPIHKLLSSIEFVFSPTIIGGAVQSHELFSKFKSINQQNLVEKGNNDIKKAIRKIRLLLHPDRLPKDLSTDQIFLCNFLWDIISDALDKYQQT